MPMSETPPIHRDLRAALIDAIGPDSYVPAAEAVKLGLPPRLARQFQTSSVQVRSVEDAESTAAWYSRVLADHTEQQKITDPGALASQVSPF